MTKGASYPVGDRELPLEADPQSDVIRDDPMAGTEAEVSPVAGGDMLPYRGKQCVITGVIRRFGYVVGYEVKVGSTLLVGSCKDVYVGRDVLEGVQPPTAMSASLRSVLSHWAEQQTYWGPSTAGLELMCFELASATRSALPVSFPWGWNFVVPDAVGGHTIVDCRAVAHDNVWTVATSVYPTQDVGDVQVTALDDHWERVFIWEELIASSMIEAGFPWGDALEGVRARSQATREVLRPLFASTMEASLKARDSLFPGMAAVGDVSVGFSRVRIAPGKVGLTEQPTDRRPYTVVSIAPGATKSLDYLRQVVLHEALHIATLSPGGEPHGKVFHALAERMGLNPQYRD